jgi:cysteine desulfurase
VYLDWNATTPPLPSVLRAIAQAMADGWGNPSSVHAEGRTARSIVEQAREAVAALAKSEPRDVVLTSGGTEANNLAIRSAFVRPGGVLALSRLEHPSVTAVAEALEREGRTRVRWVRAMASGVIDVDDLERALAEGDVRLVAVQAVNHETGAIQPVRDVAARARRAGALVHVDAVQAFGRTEDVAEVADTRSLAGHKIRGPKAMGAVIARPGLAMAPILLGGSQERGVRPGTIDAAAAAGLAAAAQHALASPARWRALRPLRDRLEEGACKLVRGARVNAAGGERMPHVASIAFRGWPSAELVAALDLEGVATSAGSACSAGTAEPSRVLQAMGDTEAAASTVRFSLGEDTTPDDVDAALGALARVLGRSCLP